MSKTEANFKLGVGLDVGTMNIVSARQSDNGKPSFKRVRDAFLDLEMEAKRSLKMSKVDYVEQDGTLVVLGDSAMTMANLFKREARRPLSRGVISAGELDAQRILGLLVHHVLDDPQSEGEHCFYSVPSAPIDDPGQDVIFHTEVFRKIVRDMGYTAHPTNEAMAIIYSQCAPENFSGLAVSFGAGMANIALAYQANKGMEFALARGGDWIDAQSAKAIGKTASQMCAIKEKGINLNSPNGREEQAIVLYVRSLINYALQNIAAQFKKVSNDVALPEPIPFVVSGGTSKADGFMDLFKEEFELVRKKFPLQVSEVRHAKDPFNAVAEGMLVLALEEHEG
jgi:hypothetical protein